MQDKGETIQILETELIRKLSYIHLHHFLHEDFALEEFFESVLVSPEEPLVCMMKNCDGKSVEDVEEILPFGAELVERSRTRKRKRRSALVVMVFQQGVERETIKRLLACKTFNKNYMPLIIDRAKNRAHYNLFKTPMTLLEVIFFIKSIKGKESVHLDPDLDHQEEIKTIHKVEKFRANFAHSRAYITWFLIAVNVLMWVLTDLMTNPKDSHVLILYGAKVAPLIWQGEVWRLVAPVFLHVGFWHLLANCVIIFILGGLLEALLGRWRLLFIYIMSGVVGNLLSMKFSPQLSAGASSGVFGILGALIAYGIAHKKIIPRNFYKMIIFYLVPFIAYNLVIGFWSQQTDNYAHIGGLLGGFFFAYILGISYPRPKVHKVNWGAVFGVTLAFSLLFVYCMEPYSEAYRIYYFIEGEAAARNGEPAAAVSYFRQCLEADPGHDKACIYLGEIYYKLGRERYGRENFNAALTYYMNALKYIPPGPDVSNLLSIISERTAACLAALGRDRESIKYYRRAIVLNDDEIRGKKLNEILANQYRIIANEYYQKYNYNEAVKYTELALEADPESLPAIRLLGMCYYSRGEISKAAGAWKKALKTKLEAGEFGNLIRVYIFKNFWYSPNIPYRPKGISPEALGYNDKGEKILLKSGDYEKARHEFNQALKLSPRYAAPLNNLGKIHLMLDDADQARDYIIKSLEADHDFYEALTEKAVLTEKEGNSEKAKEILLDGRKKRPDYAGARGVLGKIYRSEKEYDSARKQLEKALELDPGQVIFRVELAETYLDENQFDNFLMELNNGIGYAEAQGREELSMLIRLILRRANERQEMETAP